MGWEYTRTSSTCTVQYKWYARTGPSPLELRAGASRSWPSTRRSLGANASTPPSAHPSRCSARRAGLRVRSGARAVRGTLHKCTRVVQVQVRRSRTNTRDECVHIALIGSIALIRPIVLVLVHVAYSRPVLNTAWAVASAARTMNL